MALVIDGDQFGPGSWQPMLTALAQKGVVVQKCVVAAPELASNKTWAAAIEVSGIEFVPVERRVGGSKDPNDIAIALEAARLVSTGEVDAVAIGVRDGDFLHVAQRWRISGHKLIVALPEHSNLRLAHDFERSGAEVVRFELKDAKTGKTARPKMKAVLHPTGEGSVERIDDTEEQDCMVYNEAIEQKLLALEYLTAPGAPQIPAIAKSYIANAIGPLTVWPPHLALLQFEADVLQTPPSKALCKNPGDLVYVFPRSNFKRSKKDIIKFGSMGAAKELSAGGPFMTRDSAWLPEEVLRRLGYLDDGYNKDLNEAIETFASATDNRRALKELGIDLLRSCSVHSKKAALHTALTSGKLQLRWQMAPKDSSVREFLLCRGYLSAADCSVGEVWEGLNSYAQAHGIPGSKTYNALVRRVRESLNNNPSARS